MAKEIVAMLLAGGQGSRLYALTQNLAKPAVPFGGKYRIIDFPLSNCVNSGIDTVAKRKVDDAVFSSKGYCRLGKILGQRIESGALSTSQQHSNNFFCHGDSPFLYIIHGAAAAFSAAIHLAQNGDILSIISQTASVVERVFVKIIPPGGFNP